MDNDKLYEFMEKIYTELQSTRNEMKQGFKSVNERIDKVEIKLESLEKKVDTVAEVQKSHMNQNENQHIEIVEMVSDKIEVQNQAIKNNIKAVK